MKPRNHPRTQSDDPQEPRCQSSRAYRTRSPHRKTKRLDHPGRERTPLQVQPESASASCSIILPSSLRTSIPVSHLESATRCITQPQDEDRDAHQKKKDGRRRPTILCTPCDARAYERRSRISSHTSEMKASRSRETVSFERSRTEMVPASTSFSPMMSI